MPSAADYQASILDEVGAGLEGLPDSVLAAVLDKVSPYIQRYWEMYASYALVYPRLQYLYTKRHCCNVLIGQVRDLLQVSIGSASVNQGAITQNLQKIYDNTNAEIKAFEDQAKGSRVPAYGLINNPVVMDGCGKIYRTDQKPCCGSGRLPPYTSGHWIF